MRVKILIAMAIASIFLLASTLPAGAIGVAGPSGVNINIPTPGLSPPVPPVNVVPCVSFLAVNAPTAELCPPIAPISLVSPALQAQITLSGPGIPAFLPPSFVLPQLAPPVISPFQCVAPILFDP